jgi:hypothetical protein
MELRLIPDQLNHWICITKRMNIVSPKTKIVERFSICGIIDKNETNSPSIISFGNCSETFLTGGIPDLGLYSMIIDVKHSRFKFYTNSRLKIIREGILNQAFKDGGLPNPT